MKTRIIIASVFAILGITVQAQDTQTGEPKGKAIIQIFGNFHTSFGTKNDDRGFELERSYLGYEYKLTNGLSVKGIMDIGKSNDVSDYQRIVYIKNAMISWKKGNMILCGGLISTTLFDFQEKFWGYRYIMKSFQDEYQFGSSADLGLSAFYKFADWISADVIIANGEGYKLIQKNDGLNYGLGMTLNPARGFYIRLYGGLNECGEKDKKDIINMATFAGYKCDGFTVGAEYNHILNSSYKHDADQFGYSLFTSVKLAKYADLYARFDDLYSNSNWNNAKDKRVATLGAQFKLTKYVKIAPNFRITIPKAEHIKNSCYVYMNSYFGF